MSSNMTFILTSFEEHIFYNKWGKSAPLISSYEESETINIPGTQNTDRPKFYIEDVLLTQ